MPSFPVKMRNAEIDRLVGQAMVRLTRTTPLDTLTEVYLFVE